MQILSEQKGSETKKGDLIFAKVNKYQVSLLISLSWVALKSVQGASGSGDSAPCNWNITHLVFQLMTLSRQVLRTFIHSLRSSLLSADSRYLVTVLSELASQIILFLSPGFVTVSVTSTNVLGLAQSSLEATLILLVLQSLRSMSPWGSLFLLTSSSGYSQ